MRIRILEQEKARELRRQGYSLSSICRRLKVSKSSASIWCKDITLTPERIAELKSRLNAPKLGALANKLKRQKEVELIRHQARAEFSKLLSRDLKRLKDVGTVLYWAEGTKGGNSIDFTNSDPEMMRVAILWLRSVCKVSENKFRVSIYYHSGQNEAEMKAYWSEITGIPLTQFRKSIFKKEGTGHRKRILYMGTCKVRVSDKDLLYRVLTWIQQLHLN